jgi:hypothetical protein
MVPALLVSSVLEPVVWRPALVDHGAVVVEPEDGLGHGTAAGWIDDIGRGHRPHQRAQPGSVPAHPPAGLVEHHPFGLTHGPADGLVNRLAARGGSKHRVDAAGTTDGDAEEASQAAPDLAVREPALLVEFDDGGLGVGTMLSGGAEGVGRPQRMSPLQAAAALAALADVDVELPVDGLARDLHLELLGDAGPVERAAAVGAGLGQGRLVDFVDLLGAGRLAVGLGAVIFTRLPTGSLGLVGGRPLDEGSGLPLTSGRRLVELAAEALVLGLQVTQARLEGLAAGTRDGLHTSIIGEALPATALPQPQSRNQLELDALNKYRSPATRGQLTLPEHA